MSLRGVSGLPGRASDIDALGRIRNNLSTEGFFRVFAPLYKPDHVEEKPLVGHREKQFAR